MTGDGAGRTPSGRRVGAPAVPAVPAPAAGERERWDEQDRRALLALVRAYPLGADVRFRAYLPVLSPRWWRQQEAASAAGLHAGDALQVTGYGATQGVPDALLVRRVAVADAKDMLVFPLELVPPAGRRTEAGAPDEAAAGAA